MSQFWWRKKKICLLSNRFLTTWFMWRVKVNELSCVSFHIIKGIQKSLELWKTMTHSTYIPSFYAFFLSPTQKPEHGISDNWKEVMRKYDCAVCKRGVLGDLVTVCDVLETEEKLIEAARHWFANLTLKDRLNHLRGVKRNIPIRDALVQGLAEL